ncbi:MAG TPA: polysaccharide pyruvyl transferase CsaB [Candidatus Avacidaminococcus intestinavium]|uniref:Polysaccharide pyruvyl transferase CsaB n=1 Tax=Candidatus Avacidaminococcus intestinavium TaxID=2840684 RepID=A0A9D1SLG8_9FIRM|nr:polysaccharide pyruvyl transferase CsaB [Candidatus Avacidaminococcus intestinavium]
MSKILISGYYGFSNAGDEAMLAAIIGALRKEKPPTEITVISGDPENTADKHDVYSVHRFNFFQIIEAMARCNLLLSGGGSLLQDITSKRSLLYYLSILMLGKLMGKKVMLYAQGIGPIRSRFARKLVAYVCRKADLVTVRDDGSSEELRQMGVPSNQIIVTADAVFALNPSAKISGKRILQDRSITLAKPVIGFSVRQWSGEERFTAIFAEAVDLLVQKYDAEIVFIPMQFPADNNVAAMIIQKVKARENVTILDEGYSTEEYMSLIANCTLVIGMRLHALVFAALSEVPFLAVSYDPKVDRFVRSMDGKTAGDIQAITSNDIVQATEKIWQKTAYKQNEQISKLRKEAQFNALRAIKLLPK